MKEDQPSTSKMKTLMQSNFLSYSEIAFYKVGGRKSLNADKSSVWIFGSDPVNSQTLTYFPSQQKNNTHNENLGVISEYELN